MKGWSAGSVTSPARRPAAVWSEATKGQDCLLWRLVNVSPAEPLIVYSLFKHSVSFSPSAVLFLPPGQ